jgi:hypothetical protein
MLGDPATYASVTVEELLDAGMLRPRTAGTFRGRYLPS